MEGYLQDDDEKDIFENIDDDNDDDILLSHRDSRPSIFQLNKDLPIPPFPDDNEQLENDNDTSKNGEENENKDIDYLQKFKGNSRNSFEMGETSKPLNAKNDKKEENKTPKSESHKLDESEKNEKEEKEKEEETKKDTPTPTPIPAIEQEKWEKTFMSKYISVDKQCYVICFEETKNEIIISLTNEKDDDSPFSSKYEIDYLNEKFGKNISFKSIQEFRACLKDNVQKHFLEIKKPYKNVINTVWKLHPKNSNDKKTFTLISSQSWEKNLSLFFYSNLKRAEKVVKEIEDQTQMKPIQENKQISYEEKKYKKLIDKMIFLDDKIDKSDAKLKAFMDRINQNIEENGKKNIKFRTVLIFFDEKNLYNAISELISEFYIEQIFIIIFTSDSDLKKKIYQIKINENRICFFDLNNIFIFKNESNEYKKIMMPILKIFSYFNQLGDGFFKQLSDLGIKNENLEKEFKYLYNTHYFNILLCGRSGAGKSTFINTIMGEKKSFTLQYEYAGTYRNNYYIHKDYPIKIIDVCGFAEGSEVNENLERLKLIYNENSDNIIIDEYTNDSFSFYGDKRNNIHLLLYFNVYKDKYNVVPGELPIIMEAIEMKIPIIFIVNKCSNNFFDDKELRKDTIKEIKKARENTDYANYETYFIDCLNKKGFDELLTGIYKNNKENIISNDNLLKIKNNTTSEEEFNKIIEHSKFFGKINAKDVFLNESLINSVMDIKSNVVRLSGYYLKELNFFRSFKFYLYNKFYNNLFKNTEKNFFPLLTDLVKKIYSNFGFKKTTKECNNFILSKLSKYFKIKLDILEDKKDENKVNEKEENDDDDEDDDDDENEGMIITDTPMDEKNGEKKEEFDFNQFKEDYVNLGKLYWFSKKNFKIEQDNTENILKNNNDNLVDKIFNLEEENNVVKPERLFQIVKNDFGLDNSKNEATNKEKLIIKLFYISYVSNILISSLCGKINHKGFKFRSISNFYYTVSKSYNNAINGFNKIKEQIENKEGEPAPKPEA